MDRWPDSSYDPRTPPYARRNDSYRREAYAGPSARDNRSSYDYSTSPAARSSYHDPRSRVTRRRSWPPAPFAEDEVVSLRREWNAHQLLKDVAKDEARARGAVDQEPLIMDNPDVSSRQHRRFASEPENKGIPTPPTSEDERARKARRKPSKLIINDEGCVPELSRRAASPYAYTKPTKLQSGQSSKDRDYSTDNLTPPPSGIPNAKTARFAGSQPASPRRDSTRRSPSERKRYDYFNPVSANNENAIDDTEDLRSSSGKGKKVTDQPLTESPRISAVDPPGAHALPIRKLNLDARRNTDTQSTLPTMGRMTAEKTRQPTPLMTSTSLSEARTLEPNSSASLNPRSAETSSTYPRSRESSHASSRPVSPADSIGRGSNLGNRSPRLSAEFSRDSSGLGSRPGSRTGSRPGSAGASRPGSQSPMTPAVESPRLGRTDLDWTALLAANAARRTKGSSRTTAPDPQEQMPDYPRRRGTYEIPPATPQTSSSLPYPVDDSLMGSSLTMPEEQDHAYMPTQRTPVGSYSQEPASVPPSASAASTASTASTASNASSYAASTSTRPAMGRARSAYQTFKTDSSSSDTGLRSSESKKRTESFATSSETKRELQALMKKGLPACTRPEPVQGYDDWYTVIGATNIDFCPDCIGTLFERTVFRPQFRRSLPRNLSTKVRCAFGSAWTRLAWLLTLQQHRTDLSLLKDLAEIEDTTESCPGAVQTMQSWYGLRDPDGLFVRDFHVCFGDVRKIERLLPSLSGLFVKLPQRASSDKRTCAMRMDSNRFSAYLDALVSTHEKAIASRKGADPMPFIELVEHRTRLRECTRDNMLIGGLWHFAPDVPAFTVCEDCFETVIEPEIKKNLSVARKFNRTVQPVYGEGIGSSCQLYSRRMRKVFQRAVENGDLKYLVRKSNERRDAELWLQDRYREVMRRVKRLTQDGSLTDDGERRLNRELEKISLEWKEDWE